MHFRYLNKAVLNVSIKKQLPYKTSHAVRSGYAAVRKLKKKMYNVGLADLLER